MKHLIIAVTFAALAFAEAAPKTKPLPAEVQLKLNRSQKSILRMAEQQRQNIEAVTKSNQEIADKILKASEELRATAAEAQKQHCEKDWTVREEQDGSFVCSAPEPAKPEPKK